MTHETEDAYHDKVKTILERLYGARNVEHERYFEETGRFVDFWVEGPIVDLAIEVENDFEAALKGAGQSILYAANELNAVPVIILPLGHVEQPEADMMRSNIAIVEMTTPEQDAQQEEDTGN
jgi:hypothetical protein